MLIRREYAPARSPTSFSNGGGVWKGFSANSFSNCSAFGFSPAASSFLASRCACRVKTSVHFTKEAPGSTFRRASSGREQSTLASSVSTGDKGFPVSLANHQRRSRPPCSFLLQCESVRGISPTQQVVSKASLFQRSRFSFDHSVLCSISRYSFISTQSIRFAAGQIAKILALLTKANEKSRKPAAANKRQTGARTLDRRS